MNRTPRRQSNSIVRWLILLALVFVVLRVGMRFIKVLGKSASLAYGAIRGTPFPILLAIAVLLFAGVWLIRRHRKNGWENKEK